MWKLYAILLAILLGAHAAPTYNSRSLFTLSAAASDTQKKQDCIMGVKKIATTLRKILYNMKSDELIQHDDIESIYQELNSSKCQEIFAASIFGLKFPSCPVCATCATCDVCPPPITCPPVPNFASSITVTLVSGNSLSPTPAVRTFSSVPGINTVVGSEYNYGYACRVETSK